MTRGNNSDYPHFLQSFANLQTHFKEQFDNMDSQEKGEVFANFVEKLIPYTRLGRDFEQPEQQQKTRDGGVDLVAQHPTNGSLLYSQSKYTIREKSELDTIISKFADYYNKQHGFKNDPNDMFDRFNIPVERVGVDLKQIYFQIITLHDIERIKKSYEDSSLLSLAFYKQLLADDRLEIIDGHTILNILRANYRKSNLLPSDFELEFSSSIIKHGNVYLGVLSSSQLKSLYENYGDGLFFENVRDFLSSTEVNDEIVKTVVNEPSRLLERNNGIVLKTTNIEQVTPTRLRLHAGSVVNGCQTTLSIVRHAEKECFVSAKVVETTSDEAWDITRAANFQNVVKRFDLELARFLRPQIIKKNASNLGYGVRGNNSAFAVMDVIRDDEIIYEELRALFIGIFSDAPNNIFDTEYTALREDVIARFYEDDPDGSDLFESLFAIFIGTNSIVETLKGKLGNRNDTYRRFFKADKYSYRAFFTLLAACAATDIDISVSDISDSQSRYDLISNFLSKTVSLLENDVRRFNWYYRVTVQTVSASVRGRDKSEIQQYLWKYMRNTGFDVFLERVHQAADLASDLEL